MKQFYLFMFSILLTLGMVTPAFAQDDEIFTYTIDVEFNNPGSLRFTQGMRTALPVDASATTFHYEVEDDNPWTAPVLYVWPQNGYQFVRAWYDNDGVETEISIPRPTYLQLQVSNYDGKTVHIETGLPQPDASITVDIEYFPKAVGDITLKGSRTEVKNFVQGENTIEYLSSKDSQIDIRPTWEAYVMDGEEKVTNKFYSIKKNGTDISDTYDDFNKVYTVAIADGDVFSITPTPEDPNAGTNPEDLYANITFDFSEAPEGLLKSIFYNGQFINSLSELENNTLKAEKNEVIRLNFNDDYVVSSVTYNGELVSNFDNSNAKIIASESGVVKVIASEKVYGTTTYTAYVMCPEGLRVANGNFLSGEYVDLTGGEVYNEEVDVPGIDGGVSAFTIPAGQLRKVTFSVSDKYDQIVIGANNGYWLKAARKWSNLSEPIEGATKEESILLVAKKIQNDASVQVYIDESLDPSLVQLRPSRVNGDPKTRRFEHTGFTTIEFDSEYEPSFSVANNGEAWIDNSGASPKALYIATIFDSEYIIGGREMSWDSENMVYGPAALPDGGILRIAPAVRKNVKISRDRYAFAEAMQGAMWEQIELPEAGSSVTVKDYALTPLNFYIDPSSTEIYVDDVKQEAEENLVTVVITNNHKIEIKYVGEDPTVAQFTPAEGLVDSLEEIRISFPNASMVALAMDEYGDEVSADMIRFSAGNSWGPIYATVEQDWSADVPTFIYKPYPAPALPVTYKLTIPADFFTFNNYSDCAMADITGEFTLNMAQEDIEYAFEPQGYINKEYTEYGVNVAIIFGENQVAKTYDKSKMSATFNGEPVDMTTEVEYMVEYNMFMFTFDAEKYGNQEGTLELNLEEGAITMTSGQSTPAMSYSWQICEPVEFVYALSHSRDDYNLETNLLTIQVIFPGYDSVEVYNENGATLREDSYNANAYFETGRISKISHVQASPILRATANDHVFAIEFPLPTKDISYNLNIRPGTFTINGFQESDEIEHNYSLANIMTGVNGVISDILEGKIFNLQGVQLNSSLNELPAGVYIINGQKVIKK